MNSMNSQEMELISLEEMCGLLSIGKNRAYDLLKRKEVKSFKIGKVWKIPRMAIDQYIIEKAKL